MYQRNSLLDIVRRTAQSMFVPLTVCGGLRTVDDIRGVLRAGADKVALNTAALRDTELITRAARRFGSSTILVSIEAYRHDDGRLEAYVDYTAATHRPGRRGMGHAGRGAGSRGTAGHLHQSGRHGIGLRRGTDPARGRSRARAGHRWRRGRRRGPCLRGGPGGRGGRGGRRLHVPLSLPGAPRGSGRGFQLGRHTSFLRQSHSVSYMERRSIEEVKQRLQDAGCQCRQYL